MSEYIDKWCVVNRLIDLENKFQRLKPFHGNEQDMYEKICELEIFLGKSPAADVAPVVHGKNVTKMHPVDEFICSVCGFDAVDFNRYDSEEDVCYEYEYFNPYANIAPTAVQRWIWRKNNDKLRENQKYEN